MKNNIRTKLYKDTLEETYNFEKNQMEIFFDEAIDIEGKEKIAN